MEVQDPTSWEDLRSYNRITYPTFAEAARARGLLGDNRIWRQTILEAFRSKKSIRQQMRWLAVFFATANLRDPSVLLDVVLDIKPGEIDWLGKTRVGVTEIGSEERKQYVLRNLEVFLRLNGVRPDEVKKNTACEQIGLPRPDHVLIPPEEAVNVCY